MKVRDFPGLAKWVSIQCRKPLISRAIHVTHGQRLAGVRAVALWTIPHKLASLSGIALL